MQALRKENLTKFSVAIRLGRVELEIGSYGTRWGGGEVIT